MSVENRESANALTVVGPSPTGESATRSNYRLTPLDGLGLRILGSVCYE